MWVHLLLLISFSYAIFVFTASSFKLFVIPRGPLKRRDWRLGRAFASASLVSGIVAIVMFYGYGTAGLDAVITYLLLVALMAIPCVFKYRKNSIWR